LLSTPNIVVDNNILELKAAVAAVNSIVDLGAKDTLYDRMYNIAVNVREEYRQELQPNIDPWKAMLQQGWQHKFETSFDIGEIPDIESSIRRVRSAWDGLSRNAISLNVELLSHRFEQELGPLSEVLAALETSNAANLAHAFEAYQMAQIDVLERHHIEWSLAWLLADPVRLRPGYIPRGPLLVRLHSLGTHPGVDIDRAVDEIMKCTPGAGSDIASTLNRILARYEFSDLVTVAAVVAYRSNAWRLAREFGERALERLRKALSCMCEAEKAARYNDRSSTIRPIMTGNPCAGRSNLRSGSTRTPCRSARNGSIFLGARAPTLSSGHCISPAWPSTASIRRSSSWATPTTPFCPGWRPSIFAVPAAISTPTSRRIPSRSPSRRATSRPVSRKTYTSRPT
jgi:hypothetical protein